MGEQVELLRGASKLAVEATESVTLLVEELHRTIASGPALLGKPLSGPATVWTKLVYGAVRGVTRLVGAGIDGALEQLAPLLGEAEWGPQREAVLAALNGVLGDYLAETHNPLAISMELRVSGQALTLDAAGLAALKGKKLLVLLHGSAMGDLQWNQLGHDHGASLSKDLGYTSIYLRYNSGLHISTNGKAFADLMEKLVSGWPEPVEELTLLGFSMGGLVARSACAAAEASGLAWRKTLKRLVFLGTPHHGSPVERLGNWVHVLLGVSDYSAPFTRLAQLRGAGITDLRFGYVLDAHWEGRDRFAPEADRRGAIALPEGVECYAVAATTAAGPAPELPGDGLVPVASALGRHEKAELTLRFPDDHLSIAFGCHHLELVGRADVYQTVKGWLSGQPSAGQAP